MYTQSRRSPLLGIRPRKPALLMRGLVPNTISMLAFTALALVFIAIYLGPA